MRNNIILVITGDSGSGKTTIAQMLHEYYSVPLLTFSSVGKELSTLKGYKRLREYFEKCSHDIFCAELNKYLLKRILAFAEYNDCFIIEGLVSSEVIKALKDEFKNIYIVVIQTDKIIRIKRIAKRLSCSIEAAECENDLKEKIKKSLGIDEVITLSDYIIDGNREKMELFSDLLQYHFFD